MRTFSILKYNSNSQVFCFGLAISKNSFWAMHLHSGFTTADFYPLLKSHDLFVHLFFVCRRVNLTMTTHTKSSCRLASPTAEDTTTATGREATVVLPGTRLSLVSLRSATETRPLADTLVRIKLLTKNNTIHVFRCCNQKIPQRYILFSLSFYILYHMFSSLSLSLSLSLALSRLLILISYQLSLVIFLYEDIFWLEVLIIILILIFQLNSPTAGPK